MEQKGSPSLVLRIVSPRARSCALREYACVPNHDPPYTGIANRSLDPGKDEALHAACDTVGPQHNPQTIHAFNIGRGVAAVAEFLMVG